MFTSAINDTTDDRTFVRLMAIIEIGRAVDSDNFLRNGRPGPARPFEIRELVVAAAGHDINLLDLFGAHVA